MTNVRRFRLGWCTGHSPQCDHCPGRVESSAGYTMVCDCPRTDHNQPHAG